VSEPRVGEPDAADAASPRSEVAAPAAGDAAPSTVATPADLSQGESAAAASGADPGRRHFFRAFSREAIQAAAALVGTANALQRGAANATSQLVALGVQGPAALIPADATPSPGPEAPAATFRSPYRYATAELALLDQTQLPDQIAERVCHTGAEVAGAVRDGLVPGGPVLGPIVAFGLLIAAEKTRTATPFVRIATLHGTLNALRASRPASRYVQAALDRMLAAWDAVGERAEGELIADAMRTEAEAIADDAMLHHAAMGRAGAAVLPRPAGRPLEVLLHGPVGPLAGGTIGTALGVVNAAIADGVAVHAWVPEGRPSLHGARVTTLELDQADVACTVVVDGAAGWLMTRSRVDVVLVGAERIAPNGDVAGVVGTYPLAVLAARHAVPLYVCAPLAAVDGSIEDGWGMAPEERAPNELLMIQGQRVAPVTSLAYNPVLDMTPADLVTGYITEAGVVRPPFAIEPRAMGAAAEPDGPDGDELEPPAPEPPAPEPL
jgi:methylthioribose-1-phosphate isomerase